jgi:hypothetical protein
MLADAQPSSFHPQRNNSKAAKNAQVCGDHVKSNASTQPQYQPLKVAMDVPEPGHSRRKCLSRQIV